MSVYTTIGRRELEQFLRTYPLGELVDFAGISDGIENTNYFVTTTGGEFVLTLFEWLHREDLAYFLDLMAFLAEHEVPSAHPLADNDGRYLRTLKDKPAALVRRLPGHTLKEPSIAQCVAIGAALGYLHVVGQGFKAHRDNDRGPHWWHETAQRLYPHIDAQQAQLLRDEIHYQAQHRKDHLPRGVIHADLFCDNALFVGDRLTGIIDFYYACNDVLLYDVAVTINDWCSRPDGTLDEARVQAILASYREHRPVDPGESDDWPVMLRAAALRFWLSRLQDKYFPREGEITHIKDPDVFRRILEHHCANEQALRRSFPGRGVESAQGG